MVSHVLRLLNWRDSLVSCHFSAISILSSSKFTMFTWSLVSHPISYLPILHLLLDLEVQSQSHSHHYLTHCNHALYKSSPYVLGHHVKRNSIFNGSPCYVTLFGFLGPQGDHTPLDFVTTCDNGVFNGGIFMHLSIFFPPYL